MNDPLIPVYIYALCDPETDEIRYVGKSIRPFERLQNHMNEVSNCHRSHWLQSLKRRGLKPDLIILESIQGAWPWQHSERYWIARGRREGWPLTNNTSGGDGVPDLPAETRARMAAVWTGRKHTPETLAKMSRNRVGFKHSAETKARMSAVHSGRKMTWGDKIAATTQKLGPKEVAEARDALAAGAKVYQLAAKYGVHRTTMSKIKMGQYRGY